MTDLDGALMWLVIVVACTALFLLRPNSRDRMFWLIMGSLSAGYGLADLLMWLLGRETV